MPKEGEMNKEDLKQMVELLKFYEHSYVDSFVQEHPAFTAKAAMRFLDQYAIEKLPTVTDLESWTIPTNLKPFQTLEFQTAMILRGCGCSHALISEFLHRSRETVSKYLSPLDKAIEESLDLPAAESDAAILPVIEKIRKELSGKTGAV